MKLLVALFGILLLVGVLANQPRVDAQTSPVVSMCPGIVNRALLAKGYSQLSITSGAAVGLTVPAGSQMAYATVETASIRYRDDGTAPTTAVGTPFINNTTLILCGLSVLNNWKAIAISPSATLDISFYGQ